MLFISARFPFIAKHRFFLSVFSLRFLLFLAREGFQVEVYVGPMLELVLGGVLERFWEAKMRLRRPKMAPRRGK